VGKGREGMRGRKEKREGRREAEASENGMLAVPILVCFRRRCCQYTGQIDEESYFYFCFILNNSSSHSCWYMCSDVHCLLIML